MPLDVYGSGFRSHDYSINYGFGFSNGEELFVSYRKTDKIGESLQKDVAKELSRRMKNNLKDFKPEECHICGESQIKKESKKLAEMKFDNDSIAKLLRIVTKKIKNQRSKE